MKSELITALSNSPEGSAVETIISEFEIERSLPSDGLLSTLNSFVPGRVAPYVVEPPPSSSIASTQPSESMISACSYVLRPAEYGSCLPSAAISTTLPSAVNPIEERGALEIKSLSFNTFLPFCTRT